jgi:hypothetical protein
VSARTDFFSAVLDGDEAKAREIFADGRLDANVRDGLIGRDAPARSPRVAGWWIWRATF